MRSRIILGRALLVAIAVLVAGSCRDSQPLPGGAVADRLTVIVLVVDSLMPDEVGPATPNIDALKTGGTYYAESRSVFVAETIPNHVAMMTGVYPDRSGIPNNKFFDDFSVNPPEEADLSIPEELTANTLFTWIHEACVESGVDPDIRTGATLSKKYLFEIFEGDAANAARANDNPAVFNVQPDEYWNPQDDPAYLTDPAELTPDTPTMTQARSQLPLVDFQFINLGDVDRLAHASGEELRNVAKTEADTQVGLFVQDLQDSGRWDNTILFLVSDHGMDYSPPGPATLISTQGTLDGLAACFEPMLALPNGGIEGIFLLNRSASQENRRAALRAARACILGLEDCASLCPGTVAPINAGLIGGAWYSQDDPGDPDGNLPAALDSGHANLGDLAVWANATGKFGEPDPSDEEGSIPGNHGHPLTLHNTFIVSGGSPWVKKGQVIAASIAAPTVYDRLPEQSENVDLAPTIAWLLGLDLAPESFPDGQGFDGRVLKEAFVQFDGNPDAPSPSRCGRL